MSVRLPQAMLVQVLALRAALGGVETATTSATIRELLTLALAVFDPNSARRVVDYATFARISRTAAWKSVVDVGLDCLENTCDPAEIADETPTGEAP